MNLHTLHVQFMQQTQHNAKSGSHEAPSKQQFKGTYGVFRFGPIERKNEKSSARKAAFGGSF